MLIPEFYVLLFVFITIRFRSSTGKFTYFFNFKLSHEDLTEKVEEKKKEYVSEKSKNTFMHNPPSCISKWDGYLQHNISNTKRKQQSKSLKSLLITESSFLWS